MPKVVLVEVIWVLGRMYRFERLTIAAVVNDLLRIEGVRVEDEVRAALNSYVQATADFSDLSILESVRAAGALPTRTFG